MFREALFNTILAIENGRTDILKSVISACEQCEGKDEGGISLDDLLCKNVCEDGTLLHLATKLAHVDIVRALLAFGADPSVANNNSLTAYDLAIGDSALLSAYQDNLFQAVAKSQIKAIQSLVLAGLSPNCEDSPLSRNNPLHWAASYASRETISCLHELGACVNAVNTEGITPLHDAIIKKKFDCVEELLKLGANLNIIPRAGKLSGKTIGQLSLEMPELKEIMLQQNPAPDFLLTNGIKEPPEKVQPSPTALTSDFSMTGNDFLMEDNNNELSKLQGYDNGALEETMSELVSFSSVKGDILLWPQPKFMSIDHAKSPFFVNKLLHIYVHAGANFHDVVQVWESITMKGLEIVLEPIIGTSWKGQADAYILCNINPNLFLADECYHINVQEKYIRLEAVSIESLKHAIKTLNQLIFHAQENDFFIPNLVIRDRPDIKMRGVVIDLSASRVVRPNFFCQVISTFSTLKINQIVFSVCFTEKNLHCLYEPRVLMDLDNLCDSSGILLSPMLELQSPELTFNGFTPIMLSYLCCFPRAKIIYLGPVMTAKLFENSPLPVLMLQANQVVAVDASALPSEIVEANFTFNHILVHSVSQNSSGLDSLCAASSRNCLSFVVMPSCFSSKCLSGDHETGLQNIEKSCSAIRDHDGLGLLTLHSGSVFTHWSTAWPMFVATAGLSWNSSTSLAWLKGNVADLINRFVIGDPNMIVGQVIVELGRAESYLHHHAIQHIDGGEVSSVLYTLLTRPDDLALENLKPEYFKRSMRLVRKCLSELQRVEVVSVVLKELELTAELLMFGCRVGRTLMHTGRNPAEMGSTTVNLGISNLSATQRTDLANRLLVLQESFREVWMRGNLSANLNAALNVIDQLLQQFLSTEKIPDID